MFCHGITKDNNQIYVADSEVTAAAARLQLSFFTRRTVKGFPVEDVSLYDQERVLCGVSPFCSSFHRKSVK